MSVIGSASAPTQHPTNSNPKTDVGRVVPMPSSVVEFQVDLSVVIGHTDAARTFCKNDACPSNPFSRVAEALRTIREKTSSLHDGAREIGRASCRERV